MINTVVFDMGAVLINFRWEELFREMGLSGERYEKMAKATVLNPVWNEFDLGNWTEDMIQEAFTKNDPDMAEEIDAMMHERFSGLLRKFSYTDEWLDSLKAKGYRIYILSNFSEKAFRECADELDYVKKADGAVISYKIHMIKPDPNIYRYLFDTYEINPEEAVFIDDNPDNIEAAKKFGIATILFKGYDDAKRQLESLGVG